MRLLAIALLATGVSSSAAVADDIVLNAARVSPTSVALGWSGGTTLYQVYRASTPSAVVAPANVIGQTSATTDTDSSATGAILFYVVTGGHCADASTCPPPANECATSMCFSGDCGFQYVVANTPLSSQTPGDCRVLVCDGGGHVVSAPDDTDVPNDGNACTMDVCQAGTPSNPPIPDGGSCNAGAGTRCESGVCVPTVVVLRVGDGTVALSTAATPIFLEERTTAGPLVSTVSFPIAVSGSEQPCTLGGTAGTEGALARSSSENVIVMAAYSAAPGVASVSTTATSAVNRVVCSVNASGAVDSTTRLNLAFSGANVRGATSIDGTNYWVSGSSSGASGGAWYVSRGATGGTQIQATPNNSRWISIASGQLYGSASSGTFTNVFTIGAGTPTTGGQPAISLPGMPTSFASPYGFVFFDLNPNVAGLDTLYVADDRSVASGGGVQKWTFDGSSWTLATTYHNGIATGARGLSGYAAPNGNIVLFATTTESSGNSLVSFVDDFVNLSPVATVLATSPTNTVFRGVAMAPH